MISYWLALNIEMRYGFFLLVLCGLSGTWHQLKTTTKQNHVTFSLQLVSLPQTILKTFFDWLMERFNVVELLTAFFEVISGFHQYSTLRLQLELSGEKKQSGNKTLCRSSRERRKIKDVDS